MVSIDSTKSRVVYQADGKTRDFGFPFKVWKPEEVKVVLSNAGMEYEVKSGISVTLSPTGGIVHFNAAPPAGETIAILRAMPFTQSDEFAQCSRFDPQELETRLDRDCAERQQLLEAVSCAIKTPATSEQTPEEYQADYFQQVETAKTAAKSEIATLANSARTEIVAERTAAQNAANAANQSKLSAQASQAEIERLLANELANTLRQSLAAASAAKGFAADVEAAVLEAGEKAAACILDQVREFAWLAKECAASASASSCTAAASNEETWLRVKNMTQAAGEEAADCILEQASSMAEISTTQASAAALSASTAAGYAENMAEIIHEYAQKTADEIAAQITACIEIVCIDSVDMSRSHAMAAAKSASAAAGSMQALVVAVECAAEEAAAKAAEMTAQCCQEICNSCIEMSMENTRAAVLAANSAHGYMLEAKQTDICVEAEMRRKADLKLDERIAGLLASQNGFASLVENNITQVDNRVTAVSSQLQETAGDLSEQIASAKSLAQGAKNAADGAQGTADNALAAAGSADTKAQAAQADLDTHKADPAAHSQAFEAVAGDLLKYSGGKINALPQGWNTEEVITASGSWTAKVTGWHEVTLIAGGFGACFVPQWNTCISGFGGGRITALKYYTKGQEISCVIGAGGIGNSAYVSEAVSGTGHYGGNTALGDLVAFAFPWHERPKGAWNGYAGNMLLVYGSGLSLNIALAGGGPGGGSGGWAGHSDAYDYGGGGAIKWDNDDDNEEGGKGVMVVGDGAQGCVKIRYYDPEKQGVI